MAKKQDKETNPIILAADAIEQKSGEKIVGMAFKTKVSDNKKLILLLTDGKTRTKTIKGTHAQYMRWHKDAGQIVWERKQAKK